MRQVKSLVARGVKEVVLTGTALGDYGRDLGSPEGPGPTFEEIVALILRETALPRLRLSSLAPDELTEGLLGLFEAEPRLCPHVHLSLQSPHTTILRRMKRRYDGALAARSLRALAELGARLAARGLPGGLFVGMDLITGFPGETEAIFQESYQALEALPWHRLHLFPYSEREGTAATRLGGAVPIPERRARLRALMALSNTRLETHLQAVVAEGTPLEILAEGPTRPPEGQGGTWCSGTTRNYLRVLFSSPAPASQRNQVLHVRPTATHPDPRAGDGAILATPL